MKYCCFTALALAITGCARPKPPAVAALPTMKPTTVPTPQITVIAPPRDTATPTPDADEVARRAVVSRELARLRNASPEQDFAANWAAQNKKFVAIRGVGWHIPGVPQNRVLELLNKYDATPIEGTTDAISFPEIAQLNELATRYATKYNQLLLAKLDEQSAAKTD